MSRNHCPLGVAERMQIRAEQRERSGASGLMVWMLSMNFALEICAMNCVIKPIPQLVGDQVGHQEGPPFGLLDARRLPGQGGLYLQTSEK